MAKHQLRRVVQEVMAAVILDGGTPTYESVGHRSATRR